MLQRSDEPPHPGAFIRERVIPQGMSVTDAAKRLSVGRPALSNLLNGNSALSHEMAVRLEKAFGADCQMLLDRQAAFDRHARRDKERSVAVHAYVPAFLTIEARRIQSWADDSAARHLLPVLMRKLIHSTGHDLHRVDFPGYDNAERRGWDGLVAAREATPWIPEGISCWELGTGQNPRRKAESDYAARLASVPLDERSGHAFVFVTPRNWPGKVEWARDKQAAGDWRVVRALDASDLEQWLEESIPAQMWLAGELDLPVDGFETLDRFWQRWAKASDPKMTPAIFGPSLITHRCDFKKWLDKTPDRPFVIAADSKGEALAFLSRLFQDDSIAVRWRDLAAVFDSVEALRKLAGSNVPFLPVVHTEAAERELATVYRQRHCIVVRPRNAVDSKPDIALELLNHDAFRKALVEMGIEGDRSDRLARESGRSPTILRRRLSRIPAIGTPEWADETETARELIPMVLVGAWHMGENADREVLSSWGDEGYERIEKGVARFLQLDDAPVWAVGEYRGVASKIDALFAIGGYVTGQDLEKFFSQAKRVLSETDPALELPEDKRWAASLYGKVRKHSSALRDGICETLVLLSVHGNHLFRDRLGIDVEARVSALVHNLLTPLTLDKLLSHDRDLPHYAEAAPEEFLNLIAADLRQTEPAVLGLLRPADSSLFGSGCLRTGLLWSLECLAWKHLGRVSMILARLSRTEIGDTWINKPINSLLEIYHCCQPQTSASLEERIRALEALSRRFPDIGWKICIAQLNIGPQIGHPSYRPHWRTDASGAGQSVTWKEAHDFRRKALDLALAWPEHDRKTLGDLLEHLSIMPGDDQNRVWNLIDVWVKTETDEMEKAEFRERIRRFAFTRRGSRQSPSEAARKRARAVYEKLQPNDPVVRHAWLFASQWIHGPIEGIEDDDLDHEERVKKIDNLRISAMWKIWLKYKFDGVMTLLSNGGAAHVVGYSLGLAIQDIETRVEILREFLFVAGEQERKIDECMGAFLLSLENEKCDKILSEAVEGLDADRIVRLFRCAPFRWNIWRLLDRFDEAIRRQYWQKVLPHRRPHSEKELAELIDRLLEAGRPRAAFNTVEYDCNRIDTPRLKRLLFDIGAINSGPKSYDQLDPYRISEALSTLNGRSGVTRDEMARLEFMFLKALDRGKHGTPNLERHIAESPMTFVQVLAILFRRDDGGKDPHGWRIEDSERRAGLASNVCRLFDNISHIPGTTEDGAIDVEALFDWMVETRRLCAEYGRAEIGDQYIGQLLSRAPAEKDGSWPCLPVREAMERVASQGVAKGFIGGVHNRRGATVRGIEEGGKQERELVARYRHWAAQCSIDHPYVGSILENIAAHYDWQAAWHDDEVSLVQRLGH